MGRGTSSILYSTSVAEFAEPSASARLDPNAELWRFYRPMRAVSSCTWLFLALALVGCSSDSAGSGKVDILDPTEPHYGKSYAEWAAGWVSYVYSESPPECANPFTDSTGKDCVLYQDPASPVFYLVGNFGGVSRRDACPIPSDKALFLPIINVWGDNAGVPPEMVLSDADLKAYAQQNFDAYDTSSLKLNIDGQPVPHLERTAIPVTPYVAKLEAGKNPYACMGISDVQGDFPGYLAGYWALIPPLGKGKHDVTFGGHVASSTPANDVTIDVGYSFSLD